MKCNQDTYSPEQEADYMQTSLLDMNQFLPSSTTNTVAKYSDSEQVKDGSPDCTCMKGMSNCSIHPNGRDEWISSMRDSLAKTFQHPVMEQALKARKADSGKKWSGLLASYDQNDCSWKTVQQSLLGDSEMYSETWPTWGMMQDGACYQLPQLVRRTFALGGGVLRGVPTPTVTGDGGMSGKTVHHVKGTKKYIRKASGQQAQINLLDWIVANDPLLYAKMFPTATDATSWNKKIAEERKAKPIPDHRVGGKPNPMWVEWLMGWPIGATELKL